MDVILYFALSLVLECFGRVYSKAHCLGTNGVLRLLALSFFCDLSLFTHCLADFKILLWLELTMLQVNFDLIFCRRLLNCKSWCR